MLWQWTYTSRNPKRKKLQRKASTRKIPQKDEPRIVNRKEAVQALQHNKLLKNRDSVKTNAKIIIVNLLTYSYVEKVDARVEVQ